MSLTKEIAKSYVQMAKECGWKPKNYPAKVIVAYMDIYVEHCEDNGLDNDSGSISVIELISFVETEIEFD